MKERFTRHAPTSLALRVFYFKRSCRALLHWKQEITMSKNAKIIDILELINQEMILLDLWQSTLPSKEALASEEPFCCDTLTFTQWLEFILLPKMSMLLDSDLPLPSEFEILPMAEQSLDQTKHQQLIALISQLDAQF